MELTADQQARVDTAAARLAEEHGCDALSLAERVGALEWHLEEMLRVIGALKAGR